MRGLQPYFCANRAQFYWLTQIAVFLIGRTVLFQAKQQVFGVRVRGEQINLFELRAIKNHSTGDLEEVTDNPLEAEGSEFSLVHPFRICLYLR